MTTLTTPTGTYDVDAGGFTEWPKVPNIIGPRIPVGIAPYCATCDARDWMRSVSELYHVEHMMALSEILAQLRKASPCSPALSADAGNSAPDQDGSKSHAASGGEAVEWEGVLKRGICNYGAGRRFFVHDRSGNYLHTDGCWRQGCWDDNGTANAYFYSNAELETAIRKAGPPPGWVRAEPVHPVDEDDLCGHRADGSIERAAAWEEVCKVLFEVAPFWLGGNGSATERACETIRNMAKIPPEVAAVVEALRSDNAILAAECRAWRADPELAGLSSATVKAVSDTNASGALDRAKETP